MRLDLRAASVLLGLLTLAAGAATAENESSGWTITAGPKDDLYPRYVADPKRTTIGLRRMKISDSEIPDAGSPRFGLSLGARIGLFRVHAREHPDRGLQADLEVGFTGQFDSENSTDNVGWDGFYALALSYKPNETVRFRVGAHHASSHLGDEYVERTGRSRLNITREEYLAGVALQFAERLHTYAEAGYAYDRRNPVLQERGRAQAGLQYDAPRSLWRGLGWYTALDLSAYAERDWDLNTTVQAGVLLPSGDNEWRVGIEFYDGRSTMGEFFFEDEKYVSLGVWVDL